VLNKCIHHADALGRIQENQFLRLSTDAVSRLIACFGFHEALEASGNKEATMRMADEVVVRVGL
jgi:hypothetical protein